MAPPSSEPAKTHYIYVRCVSGEPPKPVSLAPKLGPLGVSPKVAGDAITKATAGMGGVKVTVEVAITNRQPVVTIVPSASTLLIQALKEAPRDRKKVKNIVHNGNITGNQIIEIARKMRKRSGAKYLSGTCREVLGTARSIGCTVDGQAPQNIQEAISNGQFVVPEE